MSRWGTENIFFIIIIQAGLWTDDGEIKEGPRDIIPDKWLPPLLSASQGGDEAGEDLNSANHANALVYTTGVWNLNLQRISYCAGEQKQVGRYN